MNKVTIKVRPIKKTFKNNVIHFIYGLYHYGLLIIGLLPSQVIRKTIYKVFGMKIGSDSIIHSRAEIFLPHMIKIGNNSIVGSKATLDGRSGIYIGNNVNFSSDVQIYTQQHDVNSSNFDVEGAGVTIGDYARISCKVIILPGVNIGKGAVVAAGAVVSKDVEEYSIVGGVPAKKNMRKKQKPNL